MPGIVTLCFLMTTQGFGCFDMLIFDRSLQKEIRALFGMILLLLTTVLLVVALMRVLDEATSTALPPKEVFVMLFISALSRSQNLVSASLFITVLLVLSRLNQDGEMTAWLAAGVSRVRFVLPVFKIALPISMAILLISCVIVPWSARWSLELEQQTLAKNDVGHLASGQFRESGDGSRVLYVQKVDEKSGVAEYVFVATRATGDKGILERAVLTAKAQFTQDPNVRRSVSLVDGQGMEINTQTQEADWLGFYRYFLYLKDPNFTYNNQDVRYKLTKDLINKDSNVDSVESREDQAELFWRLSFPLMTLVLSVLAIPLSFVRPRSGKAMHGMSALILFLIYNNATSYVFSMVEKGRISWDVGLFGLHGFVAAIAFMLLFFPGVLTRVRSVFRRNRR